MKARIKPDRERHIRTIWQWPFHLDKTHGFQRHWDVFPTHANQAQIICNSMQTPLPQWSVYIEYLQMGFPALRRCSCSLLTSRWEHGCTFNVLHVEKCASYSGYWLGCCVTLCSVLGILFSWYKITNNYFSLLIPIKEHIFGYSKQAENLYSVEMWGCFAL